MDKCEVCGEYLLPIGLRPTGRGGYVCVVCSAWARSGATKHFYRR